MAEKNAVVVAAKGKPAPGKPRKPSPSFRTEHKDLDEHVLVAAWAALGMPGRKRWCNDHPVRGLARKTLIAKRSSVGKRRAKVPKVCRTVHAGENVDLVGKKWADMVKDAQRAWLRNLRNQRLQQSSDAHRQARTVALPCAAGGASSRAPPHDHRTSRLKYAAPDKFPELQGKYTEERAHFGKGRRSEAAEAPRPDRRSWRRSTVPPQAGPERGRHQIEEAGSGCCVARHCDDDAYDDDFL